MKLLLLPLLLRSQSAHKLPAVGLTPRTPLQQQRQRRL
jgi:hypothetical protein